MPEILQRFTVSRVKNSKLYDKIPTKIPTLLKNPAGIRDWKKPSGSRVFGIPTGSRSIPAQWAEWAQNSAYPGISVTIAQMP